MENLLHRCALTMNTEYEVTVVGPKGCREYLPPEITVYETPASLIGFLAFAPIVAMRSALGSRFDLVFGGSGLVAPCLILLKTLLRLKTMCYIHGLDIVARNLAYRTIFVPSVRRVDSVIVNSANTRSLCVAAGVLPKKIEIVHPGCDIPDINKADARAELERRFGISSGAFCLLFVGRIVPRKGLLQFMEHGFGDLLERRPETVLLVVGSSPDDSLAHRNRDLQRIIEIVDDNSWNRQVKFLGKVDENTLSICYAGADCLLFPLVHVPGDVEGFGMVAIEAAAHGTPTIAFSLGGVTDAISHGKSGFLVCPGDYGTMNKVIVGISERQTSAEACRCHALKFCWTAFNATLLRSISNQIFV